MVYCSKHQKGTTQKCALSVLRLRLAHTLSSKMSYIFLARGTRNRWKTYELLLSISLNFGRNFVDRVFSVH
jgi:hypothetical protein